MEEEPSREPEPAPDPTADLGAMMKVAEALKGLDHDALQRVLGWANKFYLGRPSVGDRKPSDAAPHRARDADVSVITDFPSLLGAATMNSGLDRALLAGYFLQVVQGQQDFDGFSANRELRNAGHASANITRDLDALMSRSPQLVIQTRKQGNSKQARKLYRLTTAGIAAAEQLRRGNG